MAPEKTFNRANAGINPYVEHPALGKKIP